MLWRVLCEAWGPVSGAPLRCCILLCTRVGGCGPLTIHSRQADHSAIQPLRHHSHAPHTCMHYMHAQQRAATSTPTYGLRVVRCPAPRAGALARSSRHLTPTRRAATTKGGSKVSVPQLIQHTGCPNLDRFRQISVSEA